MIWQDIVFSVGSVLFAAALLPSLLGSEKPAIGTSLMTASILAAYVVTLGSLDLTFAAVATAVTSSLWFVLAWQVWRHAPEVVRPPSAQVPPDAGR